MKIHKRPTHSQAGFLRKMQMSNNRFWILVEGSLDRSFYSQICSNNKAVKGVAYTIALAQEVSGYNGNGKQHLLNLYRYIRQRKKLVSFLENKKTVILFILDKDVDNFEKTKAKSLHVLYTEYYSVENYLFRFGNLCSALASSAHLDIRSVTERIGFDPFIWTKKAAKNWKEWVQFCLLAKKLRINDIRNYGLKSSPIHSGPYDTYNLSKLKALYRKAKKSSSVKSSRFDNISKQVNRYVDRLYLTGKHDLIFKGNWYGKFLVEDAKKAAGSRRYLRRNLEDRILTCLLTTMDFCDSWAAPFHGRLKCAIKILDKN